MSFNDPNVVIIRNTAGQPPVRAPVHPRFGLREEEMAHSGGLITKDEVRAVTLHALRLPEEGVFWDIGAGSGAVSIEAARLCPGLRVFAVERDERQAGLIRQNSCAVRPAGAYRSGRRGAGGARVPPRARPGLYRRERRKLCAGSSTSCSGRMESGIVVVNAATLETLHDACEGLEKAGYALRISEVSVARAKPIGATRAYGRPQPGICDNGRENLDGRDPLRDRYRTGRSRAPDPQGGADTRRGGRDLRAEGEGGRREPRPLDCAEGGQHRRQRDRGGLFPHEEGGQGRQRPGA